VQQRPPVPAGTRRVVLVAAAGAEILDLIGPYQVFSTATNLFRNRHPNAAAIYRVEIVTCSRQTAFMPNCGLQMVAHKSFRDVRGEVDTLLVAGGSAIEEDRTGSQTIQWIRQLAPQTRRVGSVCTATATSTPPPASPKPVTVSRGLPRSAGSAVWVRCAAYFRGW
jgi:transcriptional regulator GlxA family with amidase domain